MPNQLTINVYFTSCNAKIEQAKTLFDTITKTEILKRRLSQ